MLRKHLNRYLFRNNKWLLLAIFGLIVIMSLLFFSLSFMNSSYKQLNAQLEVHQQEDFQFIPTVKENETVEAAVMRIEQKYNMKSEKQAYKIVHFNSFKLKLVKQTELINQLVFVEGESAKADSDIVFDINTAKMLNKLEADLNFMSYGFHKVGTAIFPSQLTPNMSLTAFEVYNPENSFIASVSDRDYDSIIAEEKIVFSGIWNEHSLAIDKNDFVYFLDFAENNELNGIQTKISMNTMIAVLSFGVLSVIVLIMVFMLIYKMIKDNEQYFGILKSIGYSNIKFFTSVVPFFFIFIIPVVIGFSISFVFQEGLFNYMNNQLSVPYYAANNSLVLLLAESCGLVFSLMLLSSITMVFMFSRQPILLIQGKREQRASKTKKMALNLFNRLKGIPKLQCKFLFSHTFVLFLTLFAGFAIGVQLLLSFSLYLFPDKLVGAIEEQFTYKYQVIFDKPLNESEQNNHEGLAYGQKSVLINEGQSLVSLKLFILNESTDQMFIQFKQYRSAANINEQLDRGIIISKWLANKYNLQKGDVVQVDDGAGRLYHLRISDIHIGLQGNELYTSAQYYKKMTNDSELLFTGMYTNNIESLPAAISVVEQHEVIEAAQKTVDRFNVFSLFIFIIGIVLGTILFIIALYIVLQNGQKHMLLLKTLGYSSRQVSRITIEGYLFVLLIGIFISLPYLSMLSSFLFDMLSKTSSFYLPIVSTLPQVIIVMVCTVMFFYFVAMFYMHQISKLKNYSLLLDE